MEEEKKEEKKEEYKEEKKEEKTGGEETSSTTISNNTKMQTMNRKTESRDFRKRKEPALRTAVGYATRFPLLL